MKKPFITNDALKKITGKNPVNPEHYGIITKMKEDWIAWAKNNNY